MGDVVVMGDRKPGKESHDWYEMVPTVHLLTSDVLLQIKRSLGSVYTKAHKRIIEHKQARAGGVFYTNNIADVKWECTVTNKPLLTRTMQLIGNLMRSGDIPVPPDIAEWSVGAISVLEHAAGEGEAHYEDLRAGEAFFVISLMQGAPYTVRFTTLVKKILPAYINNADHTE